MPPLPGGQNYQTKTRTISRGKICGFNEIYKSKE